MPPTKPKATSKKRVPVETIRHRKDKRVNIPTRELRDFVAEEEAKPRTKVCEGLLYARDPSLDPQLVWKGKDDQDREPLEVPVVPIYVQEKIHPQAIVENVKAHAAKDEPAPLPSLFADFNGIEFQEMVDFYRHSQNWSNRMILGDSLLVMTSLAEKEGLKGQVQTIYIDPPYGIRFGSNWQVSTRKRDVRDGKVEDLTRQPEQIRAFRDTWELGIHSYLSYLRDRLVVARELLTESGSVFVQIGDENVHLVRCLMDEVFGAENFFALVTFRKKMMPLGAEIAESVSDYVLWFVKDSSHAKLLPLFIDKPAEGDPSWSHAEQPEGERRRLSREEIGNHRCLPARTRVFQPISLLPAQYRPNQDFVFEFEGVSYPPPKRTCWKTDRQGMERLRLAQRLSPSGGTLRYVLFHDDYPVTRVTNLWADTAGADDQRYVVQTNTAVVKRCLLMTTDPGDLVLDPTCGSGTTAYVAEQWGRRWITIDTSRVALALARTRLMSAKYSYYLLADSPEGIKKEAEVAGVLPPTISPRTEGDVKKGFVYRRAAHVTLKSIANNEEIDAIWERYQKDLEPLRERLNTATNSQWEEWQVPREGNTSWSAEAKRHHSEWWRLRRERQKEIDALIARRAAPETLFDLPYEDPKRVRVAGPFTVESLSPHRVLDAGAEIPESERNGRNLPGAGDFTTMILDNLRKAGVQNTRRAERLVFERLESWPGAWIQAAGEYKDRGGTSRRVAISIGPEHGTVGSDQVKEAAKEAIQGSGFDLLVVCGFAFDAAAGETASEFMPKDTADPAKQYAVAYSTKQFGKLPVLLARANPDLTMGDEVLKKTGAGNLFMVFGEPDLSIERTRDGSIEVEVRGVDVYDPTTGQLRSASVDDIACWLIDTDYNGESFFVRHAYFTGAEEPYDKLKRALRAEVDETAWSALYRTRSLPFDPPSTGKIAVKVINHYGDEVLKVYPVVEGPSD